MNIAEIFTSIQGEGSYSGYPTTFVRLSGCNLRCLYCDTKAAQNPSGQTMDPGSVAEAVINTGIIHVCITGGEPLLHLPELLVLLPLLHAKGHIISIETNGTLDFREIQTYATICMDVKCPSSGEVSDLALLSSLREADSGKFVIGSPEDLSYASDVIKSHQIAGEIFFSPIFGTDSSIITSFIIEQRLKVRFQVQLHKIIGVQ